MTFSEKIKMLRKQKGLSQEQLAEQVGVSRQAVSKWETAEALPDTEKIIQLAKFFEVSIDYLLDKEMESEEEPRYEESRNGRNYYKKNKLETVSSLIKRKGHIAGYIISAYGVMILVVMRFAHYVFGRMLLGFESALPPPEFGGSVSPFALIVNLPQQFANILSILAIIIIIFGMGLAIYLKKKSSNK